MSLSPSDPQAWRVRLQTRDATQARPPALASEAWQKMFTGVREPAGFGASAEPIDAEAALTPGAGAEADLTLMCVPAGPAASDLEKRAEAAALASSPGRPPVRAGIRTARVIWTPAKAFVFAPPEGFADAIDAIVRFTVAARLTFALEAEMATLWPTLDRHVPLTHAVTAAQLKLQPQVDAATEQVMRMNANQVRVQAALEQLDPMLTASSKRLYAELVEQAALHDRLEVLEAPLELAVDHYDMVNTRLIEAKNARQSHILELLIVAVLMLEALFLLLPRLNAEAPAARPAKATSIGPQTPSGRLPVAQAAA